ncbi:MAG TPA: hypothetical protein VGL46_09495 [Pseudonocardiaceae bacterium]
MTAHPPKRDGRSARLDDKASQLDPAGHQDCSTTCGGQHRCDLAGVACVIEHDERSLPQVPPLIETATQHREHHVGVRRDTIIRDSDAAEQLLEGLRRLGRCTRVESAHVGIQDLAEVTFMDIRPLLGDAALPDARLPVDERNCRAFGAHVGD